MNTIALAALLLSIIDLPLITHRQHSLPTIEVIVNGHRSHFIVDTGCSETLVSYDVAHASAPAASTFRRDRTGLEVNGRWEEVDMAVAGQRWPKRIVGVADLTAVRDHFGKDIDGLLGIDVLREFRVVHFEFRENVLTLER